MLQVGHKLYLVMEYCAGGDLAAYLRRHHRVSEETARGLMRQLAEGLKQLWNHHLVHVSPPQPLRLHCRCSMPACFLFWASKTCVQPSVILHFTFQAPLKSCSGLDRDWHHPFKLCP